MDFCVFTATGLRLDSSHAFVDRNDVRGGCAARATGIVSRGSTSRIQNSRISGRTDCSIRGIEGIGLQVLLDGSGAELDVHSNTITGGTTNSSRNDCMVSNGGGVRLGIPINTTPVAPAGTFRNNYVTPFFCQNGGFSTVVVEETAAADPRVFENNYLYPAVSSNVIYQDDTGALMTIAAVNSLLDMTSANNLQSGSTAGMGTTAGMPLWDYFGKPRPSPPRIGSFE
jgi:hypothetical protein